MPSNSNKDSHFPLEDRNSTGWSSRVPHLFNYGQSQKIQSLNLNVYFELNNFAVIHFFARATQMRHISAFVNGIYKWHCRTPMTFYQRYYTETMFVKKLYRLITFDGTKAIQGLCMPMSDLINLTSLPIILIWNKFSITLSFKIHYKLIPNSFQIKTKFIPNQFKIHIKSNLNSF